MNTHYSNTPKEGYLPTAIKYGVIGILIINVATYVMYNLGMFTPGQDMLANILSLVLTVVPLALAIDDYRIKQLGGAINFRQALGIGFMTTLVLAILGGFVFICIFLEMIVPELKSMNPDNQLSLLINTIGYAIVCTIFGTTASLILAAFMKTDSIDKKYSEN